MKVTEWFPGDVKPVRRGVYERDFGGGGLRFYSFSRWTGSLWAYRAETPEKAAYEKFISLNNNLPWRGLTEKP